MHLVIAQWRPRDINPTQPIVTRAMRVIHQPRRDILEDVTRRLMQLGDLKHPLQTASGRIAATGLATEHHGINPNSAAEQDFCQSHLVYRLRLTPCRQSL